MTFGILGWRERRYRSTLNHLHTIPETQRATVVARELGMPVPPKMSGEQFIRYRRERDRFALIVILIVVAGVVGTMALAQNKTPASISVKPSDDGLIGYWKADDSTSDEKGRNDGRSAGQFKYERGVVGQSFGYSQPGGFVAASTNKFPDNSEDRTLEFWVLFNKNISTDSADWVSIFLAGYGTFGVPKRMYTVSLSREFGLCFSNWGSAISTGYTVEVGKWYHIAVTNVASTSTLYVNGEPHGHGLFELETASATTLYIGGVPTELVEQASEIGKYNWITQNLDGRIDEVRLYDRALSAAEVRGRYRDISAAH